VLFPLTASYLAGVLQLQERSSLASSEKGHLQ